MNIKRHWCLITTLKCNFSLLPWQLSFYRQSWGIGTYLIFCGIPSAGARSLTERVITSLSSTKILRRRSFADGIGEIEILETNTRGGSTFFALYNGKWNMEEQEFHNMRVALHAWANTFLPSVYTHTLVVDNDEFLRLDNSLVAETLPKIGLHFVDVLPSQLFPHGNLEFCLQPWYYRRLSTTWYLNPLFRRFESPLLWALEKTNRLILHGGCKTFYFCRSRLASWQSWHHGTHNSFSSCGCVAQSRLCSSNDRDMLHNTGLVYHLANPSKQHFLRERLPLYARIQTDPEKGSAGNNDLSPVRLQPVKLDHNWNTHFVAPFFPTFTDNYLKQFADDQVIAFADFSDPALDTLVGHSI